MLESLVGKPINILAATKWPVNHGERRVYLMDLIKREEKQYSESL